MDASAGFNARENRSSDSAETAVVSNAYVTAVSKKLRYLRKKSEKIKKTEEQAALGKNLNDEQKLLLESKSHIEVSLADHFNILHLIEEVARAEMKAANSSTGSIIDEPLAETLGVVETLEASTNTANISIHSTVVQTEPISSVSRIQNVGESCTSDQLKGIKENVATDISTVKSIEKLLRLIHVVSWTGGSKVLPIPVKLFSDIILGKARPPPPEEADFEETIKSNVEHVLRYVIGDNEEFGIGVTYGQLESMVDDLCKQFQTSVSNENVTYHVTYESSSDSEKIVEPMINESVKSHDCHKNDSVDGFDVHHELNGLKNSKDLENTDAPVMVDSNENDSYNVTEIDVLGGPPVIPGWVDQPPVITSWGDFSDPPTGAEPPNHINDLGTRDTGVSKPKRISNRRKPKPKQLENSQPRSSGEEVSGVNHPPKPVKNKPRNLPNGEFEAEINNLELATNGSSQMNSNQKRNHYRKPKPGPTQDNGARSVGVNGRSEANRGVDGEERMDQNDAQRRFRPRRRGVKGPERPDAEHLRD